MQTIQVQLDQKTLDFYREAIDILKQADVPFLICGAFAFERYTGIARHTKDLDIFIRESDIPAARKGFEQADYQTEIAVPHWLAKAYSGDKFVDMIYNSAHGCLPVTDLWFEHAVEDKVLDIPVLVCAPEEMIWSKAYVMARDRFDGADVAHLIRACGKELNWSRLLEQFGEHGQVLFSHLILFNFIYPTEQSCIPDWVMQQLWQPLWQQREQTRQASASEKICRGTLLAPLQYKTDVEQWGYQDARLKPYGKMSETDLERWYDHLKEEKGETNC